MNRTEMMQEVDRRVTDRLMGHLVTATKHSHKRGWRDCPCTWCSTKRSATLRIGLIDLPRDVALPEVTLAEIRKEINDWDGEPWEARKAVKKIRRDYMRQYYRTQLERLENE